MPRQFPIYDIDAVIRERDPLNVVWWFHDNMPYGCQNPEPEDALMFPEERVPRDIHQLTTYVPNGFHGMADNRDNIGDIYRGHAALAAIGADEALRIVDEVVAVLDSFRLGQLAAEGGDVYCALSSEDRERLETQLKAIDSKYVFDTQHTWRRLEREITSKAYQYVLDHIDIYRKRKSA